MEHIIQKPSNTVAEVCGSHASGDYLPFPGLVFLPPISLLLGLRAQTPMSFLSFDADFETMPDHHQHAPLSPEPAHRSLSPTLEMSAAQSGNVTRARATPVKSSIAGTPWSHRTLHTLDSLSLFRLFHAQSEGFEAQRHKSRFEL